MKGMEIKVDIFDLKTKEFMGIATSIVSYCQICFNYYLAEVEKLGIILKEVKATINIA